MIRPITLGETRFEIPSLVQGTADVALGTEAIALLPTPAHLVAVLAGLGRQAPVTTTLGKPEAFMVSLDRGPAQVALRFGSRGLRALDRVAALCRLQGGQVFTGEGDAFVRMRDAAATLGYDAQELIADPAGCVLYDAPLPRVVQRWTPIDLGRLIERLSLVANENEESGRTLFLSTAPVLARRLVRWMRSRGGQVNAAFIERDDGPRVLLEVKGLDAGCLPMLRGLPRVDAWRRLHPRLFVQAGRRHPLPLAHVAGLLPGDDLRFFGADGHHTCAPTLVFTDAADLNLPPADQMLAEPANDTRPKQPDGAVQWLPQNIRFDSFKAVPIRVRAGRRVLGETVGRLLVGASGQRALTALIYRIPPSMLATWQMVAWPNHVLLMGRNLPPIGQPLRRYGPQVLLGVKTELTPAPEPAALASLFLSNNEEGVLTADGAWRWARTSAAPVSRRLCLQMEVVSVHPPKREYTEPRQVQPVDASVFRLLWNEAID